MNSSILIACHAPNTDGPQIVMLVVGRRIHKLQL